MSVIPDTSLFLLIITDLIPDNFLMLFAAEGRRKQSQKVSLVSLSGKSVDLKKFTQFSSIRPPAPAPSPLSGNSTKFF